MERPIKRIIICCDGTWNQPDQSAGGAACPTNVVKFAALVPPVGGDGVHQRLLYHSGIGSGASRLRRLLSGATGVGITAVLVECYRWLIRIYAPGDELYFVGFSRGAYTARSLAGFIRNSGILRPENEDLLPTALALYRSRDKRHAPHAAAAKLFRQSFSWSDVTPIRCIGVWDTVGSLGVPNTIIQGALKHIARINREFHDTDLSSTVSFAYQAFAIDERRQPFLPTIWTQTEDGLAAGQRLEQTWFAGCHSDVGGGNAKSGLSDVTLEWMTQKIRKSGLTISDCTQIKRPDFPPFEPGPLEDVTESMTIFSKFLFPSGVRTIDEPESTERTDEILAKPALKRYICLENWRPLALVNYLKRNPMTLERLVSEEDQVV